MLRIELPHPTHNTDTSRNTEIAMLAGETEKITTQQTRNNNNALRWLHRIAHADIIHCCLLLVHHIAQLENTWSTAWITEVQPRCLSVVADH